MNKDKILSLRDLALDHLPKIREQRDRAMAHGRLPALLAVAGAPLRTAYSAASTAIELRAAALLALVNRHPETSTETLIPADDAMGLELTAVLINDARKMQPQIETQMLEDARLLCELSGAPLPPWMAVMDGPEPVSTEAVAIGAMYAADTGTPAPQPEALPIRTKSTVSAKPSGVPTSAMADSFAGLYGSRADWIKRLGDKPVWLRTCMTLHRGRGEGMCEWDPVLIGAYLVKKGHAKTNSVRSKFQTQAHLALWLDEWRTYEANWFHED